MKKAYVLMWLEGPLQAWGHNSKFARRDTEKFPTKSGLIGIVAAAHGKSGPLIEWLAEWGSYPLTVVAYNRVHHKTGEILSTADLCDFHMIGAGYDEDDPREMLSIPKKSDGKKPTGVAGVKLTYRYYIQDMAFAAIFEIPVELKDEVQDALQSPVWPMFLGRKCCVPTDFIYRGVFDSFDEAQSEAESICATKARRESFRVVEGEADGEIASLNDVPVSFADVRKYKDRLVTVLQAQ